MRMRPRVTVIILLGVIAIAFSAWAYLAPPSKEKIGLMARDATKQVLSVSPGVRVTFADHMFSSEVVSIEDKISIAIKEALEAERERLEELSDRYKTNLTSFEAFGHSAKSATHIILGRVQGVPEGARFPERVITVYETEKEEVDPWSDDNQKDVFAISKVANVSMDAAKEILSKIKTAGYSITTTEIAEDSKVKLLWFRDGWDSNYPVTLDWEVTLDDENIIVGYNGFMGVLEVRPIPEKEYGELMPVTVKAGYLDLKPEFNKPREVIILEKRITELEAKLSETEVDEEEYKPSVANVTWADVRLGNVEISTFYMLSGGTGVYIGDYAADLGGQWTWGQTMYDIQGRHTGMKGLILTNAHVVQSVLDFKIHISEDERTMWIIYPASVGVRYSHASNLFGTAASLMAMDGSPVLNWDCDAAIVATTALSGHTKHAAILGDSDKVKNHDPVITVGFPMMLGKMTSEGQVSNTKFSIIDSPSWGWIVKYLGDSYKWVRNTNMWVDTPIGVGGTSGSGVWALKGSQAGKVISLHNAGIGSQADIFATSLMEFKKERIIEIENDIPNNYLLRNAEYRELFFSEPYTRFAFDERLAVYEDEGFEQFVQKHYQVVSGLNIGIPINEIKEWLEETGIEPKWKEAGSKHWEK